MSLNLFGRSIRCSDSLYAIALAGVIVLNGGWRRLSVTKRFHVG